MSHFHPGLISAYNSLTDKHLAGYFSNTRIRRHLQRAGLITRSGRIVPDKEYRHKLIQRAHQKHVRECLAQAIFHKVLEMERFHQIEIKRKLEEYATRERVHKIKVDRSKRYEEDVIRILSPRPPTGARGIRKQHSGPEGEHSESSESLKDYVSSQKANERETAVSMDHDEPGSSRPNTAPGKMQRPVRLKPIHSNSTTASLRRSSPYRLLESSNENHQPFNCTKDKESRRRQTTTEASGGISPYCLPVINNFVTPVPPATKRKDRGVKVNYSGTHRGRRLRPTTASSGADINEDPPILRSSVQQSRVCVNMVYFGKAVHLSHSHDLSDLRDEVKVFQQHCGGENLCVYKGNLIEGETFQFISRRHRGFPFSLTFFLNGLQVERLSSCCEFKHRKGPRLGGRHGHFGFFSVEGASPCYKCIIAMGLDKKPTPPPKRVKEDGGREESAISPKDAAQMETERTGEDAAFHSERETSRPQEVEAQIKEETATEEDKVRDDYEEDFEADDEGPTEDVEAKAKKSPSPSSEAERQVKERDASETEDDQKDEDIKSQSGSSSSGSDREESDAEEATRDSKEDETAEQPKEVDQEETAVPPEEKEEPHPEEAATTTTEAESAVPQDSDTQNSTEVDIYEASVPSGNENKQSEETLGDKEAEKRVDESRQEEEPERAKSVQEKLADAILKESQRSSEPELSDTSTEEEEFTDKSPKQDNDDAVSEKSLTFTERQQSIVGETQCHENVVGEAEVVAQDQEDTSQTKTQEDETEQEPQEKSESTKDEEKIEEDRNEKAISGEDNHTTENDKSEGTEDTAAALQPVYEEETAEEAKTPEKDEENKSKTGVEADETGQGPTSSEQDESTVSEAHKKTENDTAALDNAAEAGAMTTRKTMEMKAEPSEEPEALNCEEAPVAEMEVTAETSSSSLEGSRHATAEIIADASEGNEDDTKEEEAEKVSAVEASKNDNQLEVGDVREEQTETSVEGDDKLEEKSEKEEDQTNPDELTEGDKSVESQADNKDKKEEEEENNESKTEATIENENILEANEEHAGKTCSDEKKVADEEKVDESEKGEDGDLVENENSQDKLDGNGVTPEKVCVAENISETNTAAEKGKDNDAEKEEEDQKENIDEQSAINKEKEESEEMKVGTDKIGEGEEKPEIAEEPLKTATADLDEENAKIPNEIIVEPEDVRDNEVANVANGTETTEETQNSKTEDEDVKKDIETVSGENEKGEIDAENGEISTGAENKSNEDEGNAQIEGENDLKITEVYKKTEDHMRDESPEVNVPGESGDGAEHHVDHKVDRPPDTDVVESGAKEGDESVEKQDESTRNESTEPEVSGIEAKEESEESEELKQDEDLADPHNENRDSDVPIRNDNVQSDISELVVLASSLDQAQPSTPMAVDSDDTAHKLNKSTVTSDSKTDKHPPTDQNATDADLSAADGENGDTEEASKASEEGASVLLKPQANSPPLTQHDKAENTAESIVAGKESPEVLAREDNTDLVTNWLSMHQSHFLETFVEPLEDLKELPSDVQVSCSNKEATQSTEPPRSASPIKTAKMSEENTLKDASESGDITKEETVESDFESNQPEEKKPEDTSQVQEETEVKDLIPKTESEQNDRQSVNKQDMRSEEHKGSMGSLEEDKVPDDLVQDDSEKTDISKTEVESIASIRHSVTVGGSESISENQTEETTTDDGPKMNATQTAIVKVNDPLPNTETEVHRENSSSPKGLPGLRTNTLKDTSETWEQSREDTEITDFRASWSDNGSREGSHYKDVLPIPSDTSTSGDRRHVIQDITDSLSKDQLSTFSVDETLFGRGSHSLLTAVRTESGH